MQKRTENIIEDINRQRCALQSEFMIIGENIQIQQAFQKAQRELILEGVNYNRNVNYFQFNRVIRKNLDQIVIIHLWNIIGEGKYCKHSLMKYLTILRENAQQCIEAFYKNGDEEDKQGIKRQIEEAAQQYPAYLQGLNTNGFFKKVKQWRNIVFAHFDDTEYLSILFTPISNEVNTPTNKEWDEKHFLPYSEIEKVYKELYAYFKKTDKVNVVTNYNLTQPAYDVMRYMIEKSAVQAP